MRSPVAVAQWLRDLDLQFAGAALVGLPAALAAFEPQLAADQPLRDPLVQWAGGLQVQRALVAGSADAAVQLSGVEICKAPLHLAFSDALAAELAAELERTRLRALAVAVLANGQIVDPYGAEKDWRDGLLRVSGDPRALWRGDLSGALKVAAIAAHTGLYPDRDILRALQRDAVLILQLDRQCWQDGLGAVLLGPRASVGLRFLQQAGVLQLLVPEVTALVDFHKSCPVHHKDIWDHTLQVIEKCPHSLVVRWSALMHDTGKVQTRTVQKGRVHFFGHEALGASLMEGVAGRFHMPPAVRDRIVYVIGHHARANAYLANWTDSAVRRLVRDMGEHLEDVLAFSRSDYTTKRSSRQAEVKTLTTQLAGHVADIVEQNAKVPPLPKGLGSLILAQTGLQAGPWLGQIQLWLEQQCEQDELPPLQTAEFYLQVVRERAPQLLDIAAGTERQRRKTT